MSRLDSSFKWPACSAVALAVLICLCCVVPSRWIAQLFFPPLAVSVEDRRSAPRAILRLWPELEIVPDEPPTDGPTAATPPPTLPADALWFEAAWQAHIDETGRSLLVRSVADTILALARLLDSLDRTMELLAEPDSSLAGRLAVLKAHYADSFEKVKPTWKCLIQQRRYREVLQQGARLFDEFLIEQRLADDRVHEGP